MSELTLSQAVARLEAQIAFHREREAFHAAQEALHRDQRTAHAAELVGLTASLEAMKSATALVAGLASRPPDAPTRAPAPDPDAGRLMTLPRMVARVVEAKAPDEVFGTAAITRDVKRRYPGRRKPVNDRLVSIVLRRMLDGGRLRAVRPGRPHHEALYSRA